MVNRKSIGLAITMLIAVSTANVQADEASHRQAVEQLFELTDMQQKIDESVASVLALQIAQNPALEIHQEVVKEFLERHIGWGSLKDALTDMYMQELDLLDKLSQLNEAQQEDYETLTGDVVALTRIINIYHWMEDNND